jgi:chloride channel protein, CIC family
MARHRIASTGPLILAFLAVAVGVIAGLGAIAFRMLIGVVHNLAFLGEFSVAYDANHHTPASPLGAWFILVPVGGALVVAFLVSKFAPEAKGHGVPEVIDAVYYQRGIIRPAVAAVKALASSISIGTGGAVGREGPIVQIGSAFGAVLGQLTRVPQWQRLTLVACGAGGGIAATFNTPIGGLLFAIELMMPEISVRTLIPVVLATGTATTVGRFAFGDNPALHIPTFRFTPAPVLGLGALASHVLLGALLGLAALVFIRAIYLAEDLFDRLPGSNYYTRHATGMLLIGIELYLFLHFTGHYYVQGVGYATVQDVLESTLVNPYFLLLLFFAKLLATSLTLGSGASGGVFSPSLFLGATLGGAFALFAGQLVPGLQLDPPTTALVGMAAVVGSATGAAVTAVVMAFEMTRDYDVILPALITVSVAYGVRRKLLRQSIYDMKLVRRGHYIPEALHTNMHLLERVKRLIHSPILRVAPERGPSRIARFFARHRQLPDVVLVQDGKVLKVVPADELVDLGESALAQILEEGGTDQYVVVSQKLQLIDLIALMRETGCEAALVTPTGELHDPRQIKGLITWGDIAAQSNLPQPLLRAREAV